MPNSKSHQAMKLSDVVSFSFRQELAAIRHQEAERANRQLIVFPTPWADMAERHLSVQSMFCRACIAAGYLTQEQMVRAAQRYRLGMSRDGGVIFWQISQAGRVYDGKVMYYKADCHRDHHRNPTWVSNELKQFYRCNADVDSVHCLFGSHLLGSQSQPVAVVEAEKTAVILSEIFPQYLWLAAGGLTELTPLKLFPLRHSQVTLFPDTDETLTAYTLWYNVAQQAMRLNGGKIAVSPLLEQKATPEQKRRKIDLIDFLYESHRVTGQKS